MPQPFCKAGILVLLMTAIIAAAPSLAQAQTVKAQPVPKKAALAPKGADPLLLASIASLKANRAAFLNAEANSVRTANAFVSSAALSYEGHKTRALNHLRAALGNLDSQAASNGTPQQRGAAKYE